MRRISKELAIVAGLCFLLLPRPTAAAEDACAADKTKLCANVDKKPGAVAKCLKQHEAQLSDACKKQIAKAAAQAEVRKACKADAKKYCAGVEPGKGRMAACLKKHESSLSAGCNAARAANHRAAAAQTPGKSAPSTSKAGGK